MYCRKCGYELNDNNEFCPVCGTEVKQQQITKQCDLCGSELNYDDKYCPKCGQTLNNNPCEPARPYNECATIIETPQSRKKAIVIITTYFIVFYILSTILSSLIVKIYCSINNLTTESLYEDLDHYANVNSISNFVVYALLFATVFVMGFSTIKDDLAKIKQNGKKFISNVGYTFGSLLVFSFVSGLIITLILLIADINYSASGNEEAIELILKSNPLNTISTIIIAVLGGPIIEELVFRKSFFALSNNKGLKIVFISALAFGAIHVILPILSALINYLGNTGSIKDILKEAIYIISYSAAGFALGYSYRRANYNIIPIITAHMLWNIFSLMLSLIMQ